MAWAIIGALMTPHMFHEHQKDRLVGTERRSFQPAEDIVSRSGAMKGSMIADLGCGNGYISVPLAELGADVVAIDTQKEMLEDLVRRSGAAGARVRPVLASLPGIPLKDGAVDHAFLINMFHELADKKHLVDECRRIIRQGGKLTLVDFQKRPTAMGPPMEERIPEEEIAAWFSGFSVDRKVSLPDFYQFEFVRS